ncbi:MAG: HlyD family efflux transporter periplasmic adaptor subunit [Saprospiraceae bacterium]
MTIIKKILILWSLIGVTLFSCNHNQVDFNATGSFEAIETIISSESQGILQEMYAEEGKTLKSGQLVAAIDSTSLLLKRKQLYAQLEVVSSKKPNVAELTQFYDEQWKVAKTQLDNLLQEKTRFEKLVASNGATKKQLDDIVTQVAISQKQLDVIKSQKRAQESSLGTQITGMESEKSVVLTQIEQIEDQIKKCVILNPVEGTVLTTYAEKNEMMAPGKPLYKIADVSQLYLRAFITGNQLPNVKIGQKVVISTDDGKGGLNEREGIITWISEKAEFTPKTIQTKDERANLVYAMKVKVANDGYLKIGMYGEVKW